MKNCTAPLLSSGSKDPSEFFHLVRDSHGIVIIGLRKQFDMSEAIRNGIDTKKPEEHGQLNCNDLISPGAFSPPPIRIDPAGLRPDGIV